MESTTQVVGHKLIKERLKYMMPMIITINLKMYEVAIQIHTSSRVQNKKYSSGKKWPFEIIRLQIYSSNFAEKVDKTR